MDTKEKIIMQIYHKINEMLGGGDQLFCMQFPAQSLNYRQYQYDTSDRNSVWTRPYAIAEAEFRLSDELFNVSPITQGPNGEKLSIVYNSLINNYLPQLEALAPFFRDRAGLGRFLLSDSGEEIEIGVNGHTTKKHASRIELCQKLYHDYLQAKHTWDEKKNKTFEEYRGKKDLDGYARWLSTDAVAEQADLDNLYNQVVVRGHLHEVMALLGYLNASSTAAELEMAKQRMRHSARSSLDESMTVYPVQFQPSNWFKALTPNLHPEDLTMAKDVVSDHLITKRQELSRVKADLKQVQLLDVDPHKIEELDKQVKDGKRAFSNAETNLIKEYGQSAVTAVRSFFAYKNKDQEGTKPQPSGTVSDAEIDQKNSIAELTTLAGKLKPAYPLKATELPAAKTELKEHIKTHSLDHEITSDQLKQAGVVEVEIAQGAVDAMVAVYKGQQAVLDSVEALTVLKARKAQLESHDMQLQKSRLEQRVNELTVEVEELTKLVSGVALEGEKKAAQPVVTDPILIEIDSYNLEQVKAKAGALVPPVKIQATELAAAQIELKTAIQASKSASGLLPKSSEEAELEGMFTSIVITSEETKQSSTKVEGGVSQETGWHASGWIFSAGGKSSSSYGTSSTESHFTSKDFTIGFRVAKVSFDRGGWFNPQLFKMSHAFYRLADLRAGAGLTVEQVQNSSKQAGELQKLLQYKNTEDQSRPYILPAFPVAMVIAKDITIKVRMDKQDSSTAKSHMENSSASGGGFLGFSYATASSGQSTAETAYHGHEGEYYSIRIPGPQVLGYFLQLVPEDKSARYQALEQANKPNPMLEALALFEAMTPNLGESGVHELEARISPHIIEQGAYVSNDE